MEQATGDAQVFAGSRDAIHPWVRRAASAIVEKRLSRVLTEEIDGIVGWILNNGSAESRALSALVEKHLPAEAARHRTVKLLGDLLFTKARSPWESLALPRTHDVDEIKRRYRRLVQVFHPDRGFGEAQWLGECTHALREAHDTCVARVNSAPTLCKPVGQVVPPKPAKASKNPKAVGSRRDLRRTLQTYLGSSASVKRKVLLGMCFVCIAWLALASVGAMS